MKITILGSGTSHGVPVIGCDCPVCQSDDVRNKRTRSSIWIEDESTSILIDTSADFRTQGLREGITRLDAVFYTHPHADHLHGLDDVRSLTWHNPLPLYANESTETEIRERFAYIFKETQKGGGKPDVYFNRLTFSPIEIGTLRIEPIEVMHGRLSILAFKIGKFSYITDCSFIPEHSFERLRGTTTLVIGALRDRPHVTHFSVKQAIEVSRKIGATRTYFTHMCHDLDHQELKDRLPDRIEPAYDGLVIEIR